MISQGQLALFCLFEYLGMLLIFFPRNQQLYCELITSWFTPATLARSDAIHLTVILILLNELFFIPSATIRNPLLQRILYPVQFQASKISLSQHFIVKRIKSDISIS